MTDLLKGLNRQQRAAATHDKGPILVVAGAGTGKTQVITHRVAHLIDKGRAKPDEILAITFTDKAAQEMETRVAELLGKYVLDVKITTFNAFGYEVVQRFAYELGFTKELRLLTESQRLVFLKQHLDDLKLRYYAPITKPEGFIADLAKYFSKLKNELLGYSEYKKFAQKQLKTATDQGSRQEARRHLELANAYGAYIKLMRNSNLIDFDDQVLLTIELLQKFPNVAQKIRAGTKYILVDEFQDTNKAQGKMVDLLAGNGKNVMVVGDDDQSIYRFRGAAVANILGFLDRYPEAKQLSLTENYRSSQQILDSAYRLIQHNNPDRLEAKYNIKKQLKGQFKGGAPELMTQLTLDEEAQAVSAAIGQRLKSGQSPLEIAVLVRKNSQAAVVGRYLEAEGVDYHVVGESRDLYYQPEVKILLHVLRVLDDPADDQSLYHLLTAPVFGISAGWLRRHTSRANRRLLPLAEVLSEEVDGNSSQDAQANKVRLALEQIAQWREQLAELSVGQFCYQFLTATGYLKKLISQAKDDPSIDNKIASLNQFFSTLREFESVSEDTSVSGYLQALPALRGAGERMLVEDLPEVFGPKVRILTVHKAKGLEFETVYLFDLSHGIFPARKQHSELEVPRPLLDKTALLAGDPHLQEERRLMYVAMTRAKKKLVLSFSPDHGGARARRPSIFIQEALGEVPELAKLTRGKVQTAQIELFRPATEPKRKNDKLDLPPNLVRGNKLVLTQRQIEDYLKCPAEFYLQHIMSPPRPVTFALEYGNLMHNLIQLYNRRRADDNPIKLAEMLEYLEANWPKESFVTTGHKKLSLTQARVTVKRFYAREQKKSTHPKYVEQSFEFELPEAETVIRGRFDAVYQDKGKVEIRDYKTGGSGVTSRQKAEERAKKSQQLGVYALAWQQIKGQIPSTLSLDFVDSGYIGRASKTARQLQTVEKNIEKVADGIRAGKFRHKSNPFCTHQEFGF